MRYRRKLLDGRTIYEMHQSLGHDPICDFCANPHPLYVFASHRMSNGQFTDCWRWCACLECAAAVINEEWSFIENKVYQKLKRLLPILPVLPLQRAVHLSMNEFYLYAIRDREGRD